MKKQLSKSEMLELWQLMRADEPLRLDCTLTRTDGVDRDSMLETEMRAWYLTLLDSGPDEMLAPINMAEKATVSTFANGLTVISAPDEVRRVLSLKFSDWDSPVSLTTSVDAVINHAENPFSTTRLAACRGSRTITVSNAEGTLTELNCAVDLGPDFYVFDDRALSELINHN